MSKNYGVKSEHLRYQAGRAPQVKKWVAHLVEKYVVNADPYTIFEARRAAREAIWAWTALTETV